MVNKNVSDGQSPERKLSPQPPFSIDDCPGSVPAAGWRNGTSLNDAGEWGNYWSSTPNEDNTHNSYNLNFNSGNHNTNWNNRNNGHTVRPVTELTIESAQPPARHFSITKERLLEDLYRAYKDARKHKRGKAYQLKFEFNLEDNLVALRDELYNQAYKPLPSTCFIIHDPKMREVFAANFRDRIVHHLFYNYTYGLFERTFIADSYSCLKGRGTHYGINRLRHHIRSVSAGYSRPCYVLKMDVKGYFMSINRGHLLAICRDSLERMRRHKAGPDGVTWEQKIDYPLVDYLLEQIVTLDPTRGCVKLGVAEEWDALPSEKSLFHSADNCGLPIGNLSSQLFSNVYMNVFDQYVKRNLGCRHYGRYVDDAYIVSDDRRYLKTLIPQIRDFLERELGLSLNEEKTRIYDARQGVEFLGAYLRPFRTYVANGSLRRMRHKLMMTTAGLSAAGRCGCSVANDERAARLHYVRAAVNSWLGVLSHCDSFCLRRVLFGHCSGLNAYGRFRADMLTFTPFLPFL